MSNDKNDPVAQMVAEMKEWEATNPGYDPTKFKSFPEFIASMEARGVRVPEHIKKRVAARYPFPHPMRQK